MFKRGDKVQVIKNCCGSLDCPYKIGSVFKINGFDTNILFIKDVDIQYYCAPHNIFKLYTDESPKPKIKMLDWDTEEI